jgi:glutamine synthetase
VGDAKLPGDLRDGPARAPDQPDCLLSEFPGVRGSAPRHRELLSEAVASSLSLSTKPGQVHFLLEGDVFTRDVIATWIETKRKKEVDYIRLRPHPSEFYLYYDA